MPSVGISRRIRQTMKVTRDRKHIWKQVSPIGKWNPRSYKMYLPRWIRAHDERSQGTTCKHSLVQACQPSAEARLCDDQPISFESLDEHVGLVFPFVLQHAHAGSISATFLFKLECNRQYGNEAQWHRNGQLDLVRSTANLRTRSIGRSLTSRDLLVGLVVGCDVGHCLV